MPQSPSIILENPDASGPVATTTTTTSCGGTAPFVVSCTGGTLTAGSLARLSITPGVAFEGKIIITVTGPTGTYLTECSFLSEFIWSCSDRDTGTIFIGDPLTLSGEAKPHTELGSAVPPVGDWKVSLTT